MNLIKMKNRERGTGVCRFNTLHGRWFGKSDKLCAQISDGNTESIIKWGSILTLKNKKGYFLVYEVWKIMGNKNIHLNIKMFSFGHL